jgi:hypothetical protein
MRTSQIKRLAETYGDPTIFAWLNMLRAAYGLPPPPNTEEGTPL